MSGFFRGLLRRRIHAVQITFQSVDMPVPELTKGREPFVDLFQLLGFYTVQTPLRVYRGLDEAGISQHPEVLGDRGLRHRELTLNFTDGTLRCGQQA